MMIQRLDASHFPDIYRIIEASFPNEEYAAYDLQEARFQEPAYQVYGYLDPSNDQVLAFVAVWVADGFTYIEHLAVDDAARGQGLGSQLVNFVLDQGKQVVLEVELPEDETSQRRIGFYERLGFHVNPYDYVQPVMNPGDESLPLLIMSSDRLLTEEEFQRLNTYMHDDQ